MVSPIGYLPDQQPRFEILDRVPGIARVFGRTPILFKSFFYECDSDRVARIPAADVLAEFLRDISDDPVPGDLRYNGCGGHRGEEDVSLVAGVHPGPSDLLRQYGAEALGVHLGAVHLDDVTGEGGRRPREKVHLDLVEVVPGHGIV